jgi:hypothetical protein
VCAGAFAGAFEEVYVAEEGTAREEHERVFQPGDQSFPCGVADDLEWGGWREQRYAPVRKSAA